MYRPALALGLLLALAACYPASGARPLAQHSPAQTGSEAGNALPAHGDTRPIAAARIISPARPLQCVPFARQASGVRIRGDAWTWWRSAEGRYRRGHRPTPGAVLVLSKTNRLRLGHLAVVTRIVNERVIVVDHANWLNRGQIHKGTPVMDVSSRNDWSRVRVWYTPGGVWGRTVYPVQGFIHARPAA
jgi:hypothetical protein